LLTLTAIEEFLNFPYHLLVIFSPEKKFTFQLCPHVVIVLGTVKVFSTSFLNTTVGTQLALTVISRELLNVFVLPPKSLTVALQTCFPLLAVIVFPAQSLVRLKVIPVTGHT